MHSRSEINISNFKEIGWGLLLLSGCIFTYIAYSHSAYADWTFDDTPILSGLRNVTDISTAWDFVRSAPNISPTGRPLALATFLLNLGDWPDHLAGFRNTNILLHLLNGLLVALLSLRIANIIPRLKNHTEGFAVTLSLIWLMQPLLASTSFHVIQRMTLASATVLLLSTLLFLFGRQLISRSPVLGYTFSSLAIFLAVFIGILFKENAILYPLMLGVLEWTVLSRYAPVKQQWFSLWKICFFIVPTALIFFYLAYYSATHAASSYLSRPFTLQERIFSEAIILFEYVRQILFPSITAMGPFQDDISRIRGADWLSLAALLGWALLIVSAITSRKKYPAYAFSVLFFLSGHLLESTVISLELYYEHRNYLPSLGLLGGLIAVIWTAKPLWPKILVLFYLLFSAQKLWQLHTLWGHPLEAASVTQNAHPTSARAIQKLSLVYQQLGRSDLAIQTMLEGLNRVPADGGISTYLLLYQCVAPNNKMLADTTSKIIDSASTLSFSRKVTETVHQIINMMSTHKCEGVTPSRLKQFTLGILNNPYYQNPKQRYVFYWAIARISDLEGDAEAALAAKINAITTKPRTDDIEGIYLELTQDSSPEKARYFLNQLRNRIPGLSSQLQSIEKKYKNPRPPE